MYQTFVCFGFVNELSKCSWNTENFAERCFMCVNNTWMHNPKYFFFKKQLDFKLCWDVFFWCHADLWWISTLPDHDFIFFRRPSLVYFYIKSYGTKRSMFSWQDICPLWYDSLEYSFRMPNTKNTKLHDLFWVCQQICPGYRKYWKHHWSAWHVCAQHL